MRIFSALLLACSLAAQTPPVGGGIITTYAGTGGVPGDAGDDGPADRARLNFVIGQQIEEFGHIAVDNQGNLYIADKGNHRIRRVDSRGVITTFAGSTRGFSPDGRPATAAQFNFPSGVAVDRAGNVYIADQGNQRVVRVDAQSRIVTTVAGDGVAGFSGDGEAAPRARLREPSAVAVDSAGNVYIADYLNDRVRMVNAQTGVITTIAGNGQHGDDDPGQDNVPADSIRLGFPAGLAVDGNNLYIADHHNNCVRVVNLSNRLIRRVAGSARHAGGTPAGDGGPAVLADLDYPVGLALDAGGNLYIADFHNNVVRRVIAPLAAGSIINTVVGTGRHSGGFPQGDGGPAREAALDFPAGLAIDGAGNLYIADWHNQVVRKVTPGSGPASQPPVISAVVNGASFAPPPARVAPGSVISLFGERLAAAPAAAVSLPLPSTLGEVSVLVTAGGTTRSMPLFYVSPSQINAQLPFEVPHSGPATVVVRSGASASAPFTINVSLSETGIFTYQNGRAVAVNQDGSLNSSSAPAARNTYITVYVTGQGALNPPAATGQPAPLDRLLHAAYEVSAAIGGIAARVDFLGATPGFVGLSQANILVPHNAPLGEQGLVITVAGHPSNTALISIADAPGAP